MGCPGCIATGWLGGWIGGYLGIQPPERPGARALSALLTANLITITVIALKVFFDISLCAGGGFTLGNVARVGIKTLGHGNHLFDWSQLYIKSLCVSPFSS